jgi:hypothetical protein
MKVGFFRGRVRASDDKRAKLWWAEAGSEFWIIEEGSEEVTRRLDPPEAVTVERVTELELPGVDAEGIESIIVNVLKGGYLEKPGVKGSGEAVLYMLVNEAIQRLSDIENESRS